MTEDEAWNFVKDHYKMTLCTIDPFGFPHATPVWYVTIRQKIYFRAQGYKKKVQNLLKHPQVTSVVEDGDKYTELRGVMIRGLARMVDNDKTKRKEVFALLAEKYNGRRDTTRMPKFWQEKFGKEHRLVIEIAPINLVSWDNRKWLQLGRSQREKRKST